MILKRYDCLKIASFLFVIFLFIPNSQATIDLLNEHYLSLIREVSDYNEKIKILTEYRDYCEKEVSKCFIRMKRLDYRMSLIHKIEKNNESVKVILTKINEYIKARNISISNLKEIVQVFNDWKSENPQYANEKVMTDILLNLEQLQYTYDSIDTTQTNIIAWIQQLLDSHDSSIIPQLYSDCNTEYEEEIDNFNNHNAKAVHLTNEINRLVNNPERKFALVPK